MTIFYSDISHYQETISLKGETAVCIKATEGSTVEDHFFDEHRAEARQEGVYYFGYHFLHMGNGDGQAAFYHKLHPNLPVMVDAELPYENAPIWPSLKDVLDFYNGINGRGGRCHLAYIPHWFWQDHWHEPDLTGFRHLHHGPLRLVSSNYPTAGYSENGPGWTPYGGMWPQIWQYTNKHLMNGKRVDYNAFKGNLDDLRNMAQIGRLPRHAR